MEIARFRKRMFRTARGYMAFTLPKSLGDVITTRDVEITAYSNGILVIKPLNKDSELKKLIEGLS